MRMATVEHESCQEYHYVTATKKDRLIPRLIDIPLPKCRTRLPPPRMVYNDAQTAVFDDY